MTSILFSIKVNTSVKKEKNFLDGNIRNSPVKTRSKEMENKLWEITRLSKQILNLDKTKVQKINN